MGVGRPKGASTMIKTIQYLAAADSSRVLVTLDLKAAFQNVSRRAMLHSIQQSDRDLAVFSKWHTGTTEHRMHYESAYTKISANSGVDQGMSSLDLRRLRYHSSCSSISAGQNDPSA